MLSVTESTSGPVLDDEALAGVDAYFRATNYLSVGQIYLLDNPLLKKPLAPEHIKPRLLGHWGTTPGLNLIYAHCNRVIRERDLDMIYIIGPGHGGRRSPRTAGSRAATATPTRRCGATRRACTAVPAVLLPRRIPSHVAPELPGSIHEGGELGYSLAHAFGAAFDNPELVVTCVVGDGEAETGALATSWQSTRFINAARDGAVLPILHLNGYKIANPTVLSRIGDDAWRSCSRVRLEAVPRRGRRPDARAPGHGRDPGHGAGRDPRHPGAARAGEHGGRSPGDPEMLWPMIVMRTPKGWTGPEKVDGVLVEGTWRAHQVPLTEVRSNPEHLAQLEGWLRSYRPEELFDDNGTPVEQLRAWAPSGERRMGANPHANGGRLTVDLDLPDFRDFGVDVPQPGGSVAEATRVLGDFLAEAMRRNMQNFRLFGPDETASNRLAAVFAVTNKAWNADVLPTDEHLAPDGRVMEVLSEHLCQGWLEGYLLTGRHGLFSCYEAFIHIIDSMFNQHAKWLKTTQRIEWRASIPSLNYLLTSHVWRRTTTASRTRTPASSTTS